MFVRTRIVSASAILAGALTLSASPALATSAKTTVVCGQTLTHSVKLGNDLRNCPAGGLVVGADGITVDLNGHTIDGVVTTTADCNVRPFGTPGIDTGGHNGLTIKNGTVQQFLNGIAAGVFTGGSSTAGMAGSSVHDLTVRDNSFDGIGIGGEQLTFDNRIERNVISDSRCGAGIELHGTHGNRIAGNRSTSNGGTGIFVIGLDHTVIEDNRVTGNIEGIFSGFGSDNVIRNNTVSGNTDFGIHIFLDHDDEIAGNQVSDNDVGIVLESANANEVAHNRVVRNRDDIAVYGDGNTVVGNWVADAVGGCQDCGIGILVGVGTGNVIAANEISGTLLDGIHVVAFEPDSVTTGTVVRDNRVRDATVDGFSVTTEGEGTVSGTLLQRNVATGSGDDGFDVLSPTTTLTANLAVRNHDLGIDAIPGVIDGGRNKAFANGNPAQCVGVACS